MSAIANCGSNVVITGGCGCGCGCNGSGGYSGSGDGSIDDPTNPNNNTVGSTQFGATCQGGLLQINWSSVSGATIYEVLEDGQSIYNSNGNTHQHLPDNGSHTYELIARDSNGDTVDSRTFDFYADGTCDNNPSGTPVSQSEMWLKFDCSTLEFSWEAITGTTEYELSETTLGVTYTGSATTFYNGSEPTEPSTWTIVARDANGDTLATANMTYQTIQEAISFSVSNNGWTKDHLLGSSVEVIDPNPTQFDPLLQAECGLTGMIAIGAGGTYEKFWILKAPNQAFSCVTQIDFQLSIGITRTALNGYGGNHHIAIGTWDGSWTQLAGKAITLTSSWNGTTWVQCNFSETLILAQATSFVPAIRFEQGTHYKSTSFKMVYSVTIHHKGKSE